MTHHIAATNLDTKAIAERYRFRDDIGLLFDPRSGDLHRLENETAIDMFRAAKRGLSFAEIVREITDMYDASPEDVAADASTFFQTLSKGRTISTNSDWYSVDKGFSARLQFPIRLEIELTSVCNWSCGFCYNVWKIDPRLSDVEVARLARGMPNKHLDAATAMALLDECAQEGCFVVRYSGGEPLVHPNAMEIIEHGGRLGLYQVLFSNGHFLTPDRVARLAAANVRCVLVSIHGDRDTQNRLAGHAMAYDRAVGAMQNVLAAGIEVVAEATLVQDNHRGILDIIRDVYARGVREFRVMRYVPTGRKDEHYAVPAEVMLPLMEEIDILIATECPGLRVGWPCGQKFCTASADSPLSAEDPTMPLRFSQLTGHCESGLVWGSVSFDGRVRNCPHSNRYFGNVKEGLRAPWDAVSAAVELAVAPRASCGTCSVAGTCRGGCHLPHFLIDPAGLTSQP